MKRKISMWTALFLAGELLLGSVSTSFGIGSSAVYAASEFGINVSPGQGAAYVGVDTTLRLNFDRLVNPQAGEISITPKGASTPFVTIPIGSYGLIGTSKDYELKWGAGQLLAPNKTYTVTIPKGVFKDADGNESALTVWDFTTAPEANNTIAASEFSPANNARVDAGTLAQISLRLNKKLLPGGGSVKLISSADNSTVQSFKMVDGEPGVDIKSSADATSVTLTLANKLKVGANYYVLIDAYAFRDDDFRTFAGISDGSVWAFSTKAVADFPVTPYPANGAGEVSTTGALALTFDRPMKPVSGVITVAAGGVLDGRTRWLDVNSTGVTGGGSNVITLNPASTASPLLNGTAYTVSIPQGSFYDQDGNVFPASGPYTWSFTTVSQAGPSVSSLNPADRSEGVAINKTFAITFSRDVNFNGSIANGVTLYKSNGVKVPASVTKGTTAREYLITPGAALDGDTTYYIDIAKGAFTDATDSKILYDGLSGKSSWSFRTAVIDKTAPQLSSAQLENNRTIRLKYNKSLNSSAALLTSSFAVTVNDEKRPIDSVYIQGDSVFVVLSTGVAVGQVVKVTYSGGLRTIQDTSGNAASTFSSREVTNTIESSMPTPKDGRISNRSVVLNFNDILKPVHSYAYSQFLVTADGYSLGVSSISYSGNSVYLTVNGDAGNGTVVRVSYYASSYPLQNQFGQNIADFSEFFIRNTNDTIPPVFQSATGAGNKITLSYNEGLSTTNLPMNSQFSVLVGNSPNYVTNVAVNGSQVILTLQSALPVNKDVTISYVPGTSGISDLNGNFAAYINLQPVTLSSTTAVSEIASATVNGDELTVTFNKNMQASSTLYNNQFGVKVDGSTVGVQSYTLSGSTLKLVLSSMVKSGQKVELSYIGSSQIKDLSGNALASFNGLAVQNLTGSTSSNGNRPSYLGTLAASEFGTEYAILKSDSATVANDLSLYNQPAKRYGLSSEKVAASYDYLLKTGAPILAFEVPSTENSAYVTIPLKPLQDTVNRNKNAKLTIRFGEHLYTIALGDIDINRLVTSLGSDVSNISLMFRMEGVPIGTFGTLEQKIQSQGMQAVTRLMDIRIHAAVGTNFSNAVAVTAGGEYTARTTSTLNNAQTSAARMDLTYNDAVYLPTKMSKSGNYTLLTARTSGNLVLGTFLSMRSFTDMIKHWSKNVVAELAAKNIIDSSYGYNFIPDQKITRAEFAVMLSRGLGLQGDRESAQRFRDVQSNTQTGDYIGAAAKAGIITGNTDGTFRPSQNITREQMAIMMIRALDYTGNTTTLNGGSANVLSIFKDKAKIQNQSAEFVAKAVQAGIILGMPGGTFLPQGNATRAEGAVMLQRMLSKAGYL
ncbi:Ig-like domain-containing protein [Paenibacillus sp. NPDC058177]|uniref:Ig-like domain-containing protein n=1 Tax=Paenibacillus sp. NPDC058177 TaxID=3346369 RepID=UPI0036DEFABA